MYSHPEQLLEPAIFHNGTAYFLERSDTPTGSFFGGPFEGKISGVKHGPRNLHHVATINGGCFEPLLHVIGGLTLRLLYGICFSGCEMDYQIDGSEIKLRRIEPKRSDKNWPYADYPIHLPYYPLQLKCAEKCCLADFQKVSCQPLNVRDSDALIIVPPSPRLGISLWGPSGDMECVQILFQCDLETGIVKAHNQCG